MVTVRRRALTPDWPCRRSYPIHGLARMSRKNCRPFFLRGPRPRPVWRASGDVLVFVGPSWELKNENHEKGHFRARGRSEALDLPLRQHRQAPRYVDALFINALFYQYNSRPTFACRRVCGNKTYDDKLRNKIRFLLMVKNVLCGVQNEECKQYTDKLFLPKHYQNILS